jgi:hypothetical protein
MKIAAYDAHVIVIRPRPGSEGFAVAEATQRQEHQPGPPEGKVIGAIHPDTVEKLSAALVVAGFPANQIDVVTPEELERIASPFNERGLRGLVDRFLLSLGEDFDELDDLRQEALAGAVLVGVPVDSEDSMHRAGQIMREHGGHEVTHFGRWKITSL